jgi:hypothetical protein
MGLFSFLFGGKKSKDKAAAKPAAKPPAEKVSRTEQASAPVVVVTPGITQAKLRLKLSASLRTGQHAAAYEAASALADIQLRAGRKTVARVWQQEADRIRMTLDA